MMKKILVFLLAGLLATLISGCQSFSRNISGTTLAGADQDAVLAFSETKTDNLLRGWNDGDYTVFSKDFDEVMRKSMTPAVFEYLKQDRDARFGRYVSRTVEDVVEGYDGFYTVIYDAVFEKDPDVMIRVVFRGEDPHQISGLWFNK